MAKFPWAARGQPTPLPTELPTFSYLKVVGCPLSCQLFPYKEVVAALFVYGKIPMGSPPAQFFHILLAVGCLLSCPLFPYMEVVGSLICMAKFHGQPTGNPLCCPRAAHGQRSGQLPYFFRMGRAHCMDKLIILPVMRYFLLVLDTCDVFKGVICKD